MLLEVCPAVSDVTHATKKEGVNIHMFVAIN